MRKYKTAITYFYSIFCLFSLSSASAENAEPGTTVSKERLPASYHPKTLQEQLPEKIKPMEPRDESEVESDSLFGTWGGFKKKLSQNGLDLSLIYKGEINRNLSGGNTVKTAYLENLDFRINIDADKLMGLKSTSFFIYALGNKGADSGNVPSKNVGDAQGTSNIETKVDDLRIYELWAQKLFFEDRFSLLAGFHDLNSEFYVTESSGMFFNASFGVGRELSQTSVNGPSIFPYTAPAIRLRTEPTKNFYLQTALFEAKAGDLAHLKGTSLNSDRSLGHLFITEAAYLSENPERPAKYAVGEWSYSHSFDHLTQTLTTANGDTIAAPAISSGFYVLADQALTHDVSVFLRHGRASSQTNIYSTCTSAGILIKNPLPTRTKDKLGLGVTSITPGEEYVQSQQKQGIDLKSKEVTFEINYRIEVVPGLAIQPDFQYITSPNLSTQLNNSQYGALRLELNF